MFKRKRVRLTSPAGVAKYPYLTNPDTQFSPEGEYKVSLLLDPAEHGEFLSRLDELVDKAVEQAKKELIEKGRKAQAKQVLRQDPYREEYDEQGEPTGRVEVRFKSKALVKTRDGKTLELRPALFDAKGQPINPNDISIYGGSVIRVNFTPRPYYIAGTRLAGVTLQINAVQVLELVSGGMGGTAESFGFDVEEDGFDISEVKSDPASQEHDEDDVDVPFDINAEDDIGMVLEGVDF